MAFIAANLRHMGGPPGRANYRYDTTDIYTTVDSDGYISNRDDLTNLQKGDVITNVQWSTLDTGTVTMVTMMIVTHVNAATDALPGDVNLAQIVLAATPLLSTSD